MNLFNQLLLLLKSKTILMVLIPTLVVTAGLTTYLSLTNSEDLKGISDDAKDEIALEEETSDFEKTTDKKVEDNLTDEEEGITEKNNEAGKEEQEENNVTESTNKEDKITESDSNKTELTTQNPKEQSKQETNSSNVEGKTTQTQSNQETPKSETKTDSNPVVEPQQPKTESKPVVEQPKPTPESQPKQEESKPVENPQQPRHNLNKDSVFNTLESNGFYISHDLDLHYFATYNPFMDNAPGYDSITINLENDDIWYFVVFNWVTPEIPETEKIPGKAQLALKQIIPSGADHIYSVVKSAAETGQHKDLEKTFTYDGLKVVVHFRGSEPKHVEVNFYP